MPLRGPYVQHGSWTASLRCSASFIGHECSQRIEFKVAVLAFRCLHVDHGSTTLYRAVRQTYGSFSTATIRSASALELNVPPTRRVIVGDRAFMEGRCGRPSIYALGVTAARVWNGIGTVCRLTSSSRHRLLSSSDVC